LQRDTLDGTAGTAGISADMLAARNDFAAGKTSAAEGLQIFNLTTKCVETWNGSVWISKCATTPAAPVGLCLTALADGGSGSITYTYTPTVYAADPDSYVTPNQYEFFVGTTSKGKQTSESITLTAAEVGSDAVSVSSYYPTFTQLAVPDLTFTENGVNFTMKGVQGGTFTMGMDEAEFDICFGASGYWNEEYAGGATGKEYFGKHSVNVSSFLMGEPEITRSQWVAVMGMLPQQNYPNESTQNGITTYSGSYANYPVNRVSWYDAITFCNKLSILRLFTRYRQSIRRQQ
jgi:hypothetical protein